MAQAVVKSNLFHEYRGKTIVIQFAIEEKKLTEFKKSFTTDKHISTREWYQIMMELNKIIDDVMNNKIDWKKKIKGSFSIQQSVLEGKYQILPKEKSYINFSRLEYELDWFLKVTLGNNMAKLSASSSESEPVIKKIKKEPEIIKIEESNGGASSAAGDDFEKLIDSTLMKENTSRNVIDLSDDEVHDEKRLKNQEGTKYSLRNTPKPAKGMLDKWLTKTDHAELTSNITKRRGGKQVAKRNSSEPFKSRFDSAKLEALQKEQCDIIPKFIESQTLKEKRYAERKEELKDLPMLSCMHYNNNELKERLQPLKEQILELLEKPYQKGKTSIEDCEVDYLIFTTAEIISDDQQMFIFDQVGKMRNSSIHDPLLYEVIMPFIIVELFKQAHGFTTKEAIDRIKLQEERRDMFTDNSSRTSF